MGSVRSWKGKLEAKEKVMNQDKAPHHMIFGALILFVLFAGLTLYAVSLVEAGPAPDNAVSSATFRTKCAVCHGQDGGGSEVGKSMNVPDLRSPVVQKLSDAQLAQIISNGKGGMPAFKASLSEDQIHALVTHIRSMRSKK